MQMVTLGGARAHDSILMFLTYGLEFNFNFNFSPQLARLFDFSKLKGDRSGDVSLMHTPHREQQVQADLLHADSQLLNHQNQTFQYLKLLPDSTKFAGTSVKFDMAPNILYFILLLVYYSTLWHMQPHIYIRTSLIKL